MEVKIKKPKSYIREMEISVPYKNLEEERRKIAGSYRSRAVVPGFRKGKAPVSVIVNRFKKEIEKEAQDNVIKYAFEKAVSDNNLNPITNAAIKDILIPKKEGKITFRAHFQVIPDFELKLDNIKTIYKPRKVSGKDVKNVISDLQKKYTTLRPVSRPSKAGDNIEFDYTVLDDNGKKIDAAQGMTADCKARRDKSSLSFLICNVKVGDSIKGEIHYPESFPVIELHGKLVTISIKVKEVKEKIIHKIDEDFAKIIGLNTLKELKESIHKQLSKENDERANSTGQDELIDKLLQQNNFEVPEALVNYYLQKLKEENNESSDEEELRRMIKKRVQLDIILDKIAEKEKFDVYDNLLNKIIEKETVNGSVNEEDLRKYLQDTGKMQDIILISERKRAFEFLLKNFLIKG